MDYLSYPNNEKIKRKKVMEFLHFIENKNIPFITRSGHNGLWPPDCLHLNTQTWSTYLMIFQKMLYKEWNENVVTLLDNVENF